MPKSELAVVSKYSCPICNTIYDIPEDAQECLDKGVYNKTPDIKVGDIVYMEGGFGWFNGDPAWVSNIEVGTGEPGGVSTHHIKNRGSALDPNPDHGNCFGYCCCYRFYYVITKVGTWEHDPHRAYFWGMTKAMSEGYRRTTRLTDDGPLELVENPPSNVVDEVNQWLASGEDELPPPVLPEPELGSEPEPEPEPEPELEVEVEVDPVAMALATEAAIQDREVHDFLPKDWENMTEEELLALAPDGVAKGLWWSYLGAEDEMQDYIKQALADDKFIFPAGWITPDGVWYGCRTKDHLRLSAALAIVLDIKGPVRGVYPSYTLNGYPSFTYPDPGDLLIRLGWLKVTESIFDGRIFQKRSTMPIPHNQMATLDRYQRKWGDVTDSWGRLQEGGGK